MTYLSVQNPVKKISPALAAGLALMIAAVISVSGVNVFGLYYGFGFLPLLVLLIWPKRANTLLSLAIVFLAGIFMDWATGGLRGQSSLIFVLVWGYLRPECRSAPFAPVSLFMIWILTCALAILVIAVSGYFVFGINPDFFPLLRQAILATLLFPLLILLRRMVVLRLNENDNWGL